MHLFRQMCRWCAMCWLDTRCTDILRPLQGRGDMILVSFQKGSVSRLADWCTCLLRLCGLCVQACISCCAHAQRAHKHKTHEMDRPNLIITLGSSKKQSVCMWVVRVTCNCWQTLRIVRFFCMGHREEPPNIIRQNTLDCQLAD